MPSSVSAITFYCFLFETTLFCFSLWRIPADVASGVIACPFRRGGILSPTRRKYRGTFCFLSSRFPYTIISPSSHHLCLPLPPFAVYHCPASLPHPHPPPLSPSSRNIFLPSSQLSLLPSIARLRLSIYTTISILV